NLTIPQHRASVTRSSHRSGRDTMPVVLSCSSVMQSKRARLSIRRPLGPSLAWLSLRPVQLDYIQDALDQPHSPHNADPSVAPRTGRAWPSVSSGNTLELRA